MMRSRPGLRWATCCSLLLLAAGCQSAYRKASEQVATLEMNGQYGEAASVARSALRKNGKDKNNRVIYLLEAGRATQIAGELPASSEYYAEVYEILRPYLDTKAEARVTEAIATTVVNQTVAEYKGTVAERIMLNTLQALNMIAEGDYPAARVEFNRARDWQQDAVAKAQEQIEQSEKKLDSEAKKNGIPARSLKVPPQLRQAYEGLGDMRGYADWKNPFTSWLRAVFLLANATDDGDVGNARFDLRDVVSMNPDAAPLVDPDLEAIEQVRIKPRTWVVFMSGLAPTLEEFRLDIPIPVGNVNYVAAAFPVLKPRSGAVRGLRLEADGETVDGVLLANMDAIVGADYQKRLPIIVAQEILSAALKTTATWAARESAGDAGVYAQMAGIVYQAVTTAADLRTWKTLPKLIFAAGVATPASGTLTVRSRDGRVLAEPTIEPDAFNLVVIVLPSGAAPSAAVQSLRLDPGGRRSPEATDGSTSG